MEVVFANTVKAIQNLSLKILEFCQNPRPSYEVEGQKFTFDNFLKMLLDAMKMLLEFAAALDPTYKVSVAA